MTKPLALLTSLLLLATLTSASLAEEPPLKVFILAGTSNMLGANAKVGDLPEDLKEPLKDILVYRGGEWTPLEAGKNLVGNEATFGQAITRHLGEPIGIVWVSVRYVASPSIGPGINNIVKQSKAKGRPIEIAGLLLDVSFGDGLKEETAKSYSDNLQKWVAATRQDLGTDHLPIVLMRAIPPLPSTPHLETVRQAQDDLKLENLLVIPCDDVPRSGDKVHFTTAGRLEMGKRYAKGMMDQLKAEK